MTLEQASAYRRAHQNALDVQNACNLSGVVHSLVRDIQTLRDSPDCTGTSWINRHPVVLWYVDKLVDLTGRPDSTELSRAYDQLTAAANTPDWSHIDTSTD